MIAISVHKDNQYVTQFTNAFADGLKRHGEEYELVEWNSSAVYDLHVIWGVRAENTIAAQASRGLPYLVGELGYFGNRAGLISLGFNGLNNRAIFPTATSDDRWKKHGVRVHPWREDGRYVLVAGQVIDDKSLAGLKDPMGWYNQVCSTLSKNHEVIYRRHPKAAVSKFYPKSAILDDNKLLVDSLKDCKALFTYNSNSAVEAAILGVPVIVCDKGSMAWDVAEVWNGGDFNLVRPDRTAWLSRLGYCQWTHNEIRSGDAWDKLKLVYERLV